MRFKMQSPRVSIEEMGGKEETKKNGAVGGKVMAGKCWRVSLVLARASDYLQQ
ncbi:unnamed protein product [Sphenostylis stenocarpa]|uniref:Uncharacterized protein n=1 Tax=Sphenostylis stenocarpa TaxID=92480 RepID=A0AA86SMX8_9FABA|nr:unnamed protein product [Sphenostylis stenocarpa]